MPNLSVINGVKNFVLDNKYEFLIDYKNEKTEILMVCGSNIVNTSQLPNTFHMLSKMLPAVLKSRCFNKENKPFFEEVVETEIGHLFEHVLLEFFCQYKVLEGCRQVAVSGVTDWNWKKDPVGTFRITINSGKNDATTFFKAFEKSIELLGILLNQRYL